MQKPSYDSRNDVNCLEEFLLQLEPFRLVSLWDMLRFYADRFLGMNHALTHMRHIFTLDGCIKDVDLTKEYNRNSMVNFVNVLYMMLLDLNLTMSAKQALFIKERLEHVDQIDQSICDLTFELYRRIKDEFEDQLFFMIPSDRAKFYESNTPIWDKEAQIKFADLTYDMDEACKCYAFSRSTACVFHLMRIMEVGVQRFGRKLRIHLNPKEERWYQILLHVNKTIDSMPERTSKQKEKKERYKLLCKSLDVVRIAWRNKVMHPKSTYTEEEAADIIQTVKIFMNDLAKII